MRALIDGDVLRYRYGFAVQKKDKDTGTLIVDTEANLLAALRTGIRYMVARAGCDTWQIYLSGKGNFRLGIAPEYKANRKDSEKPYYFDALTAYLIQCEGAIVTLGFEADDILATECLIDPENTVICTIDKDLNQVPGWHYNFVKDKLYYVQPFEGEYSLAMQMLTGDTVDNIIGIPGIGEKKAEKILESAENNVQLFDCVYAAYEKYFGESAAQEYNKNYFLLKMVDLRYFWDEDSRKNVYDKFIAEN